MCMDDEDIDEGGGGDENTKDDADDGDDENIFSARNMFSPLSTVRGRGGLVDKKDEDDDEGNDRSVERRGTGVGEEVSLFLAITKSNAASYIHPYFNLSALIFDEKTKTPIQ